MSRQLAGMLYGTALFFCTTAAKAQYFTPPAPEIVSAWKHNTENLVVIFRHDGVFYIADGDGGETGQPGMERGTFTWNKASGAFSANVIVDTNGDAGFSHPNGTTAISITGNTLTYNVTGEGNFLFTRIVNTSSAIVGTWHIPGQDANLTFLAGGTYYHSEESDNAPDSTTGMERGTYTWNSGTGAFSGNPITDTNGDIGLSDHGPNPSTVSITGNVMTLYDGAGTYTARRISPILSPLVRNDFEVDKFANHRQTSTSAPAPLVGPPTDDQPFWGEAYIEDTVSGTGGTLTIGTQAARNFVNDFGWGIETEYTSLAALNAASAFPNGANYLFSRTGGAATLSFPANGTFPPAPAVVGGNGNGTWNNGEFILGENQSLIWTAHTAYDPATLVTVLTVVDQDTAEEIMYEEVIQGDIASFDFRGKLTSGRSYDVQLEHVKIAGSTTSGTGPFAGKLGYALYNSNTRFTMVAPGAPVTTAAVDLVYAVKDVRHKQTGPSTIILDPTPVSPTNGGPFGFGAGVDGQNMQELAAPTVTPPPGTPSSIEDPFYGTLFFSVEDQAWRYGPNANDWGDLTQAGIDARFPNGTYTFLVDGVSVPLSLTGNSYPNIPQLTLTGGSWINGRYAMDAANALTVTTNTFTGYGANADGRIGLGVNDSGVEFFRSSSPSTDFATYTVPANTLPTNEITDVDAEFGAIVAKSNAIPGAYCAALYARILTAEVHILPKIVTQSASRIMQPNESVNLQVTATGSPASPGGGMNYQWSKNGTILPDETLPTLAVLATSTASAGTYTCTVSNAVGSATTQPIILEYADAYQAYAAGFALNSVTSGAPDADFDNDGIDNLLEFILGGSPTAPNPNLLKSATTTPAAVGRNLVFFYDRKTAANGIPQVMETSPSLTGTWTPAIHGVAGVVITTATLDASTQRVTATIPSTESKLFVRLRANR